MTPNEEVLVPEPKYLRKLPAPPDGRRVETGPVAFGDDWPGVFIRGDQAIYFAELMRNVHPRAGLPRMAMRDLAKLLASCDTREPDVDEA